MISTVQYGGINKEQGERFSFFKFYLIDAIILKKVKKRGTLQYFSLTKKRTSLERRCSLIDKALRIVLISTL